MKPQTQVYPFFDGVDVSAFCVPKLLEIAMISGSFQVGETVVGRTRTIGVLPLDTRNVDASITFRVAATNHKESYLILHREDTLQIHMTDNNYLDRIHQLHPF